MSSLYSDEFYEDQAPGSARSAQVVLPMVFELLRPASMVDVGCGVGTWLRVATELGVERVLGIDGQYALTAGLQIPVESFVAADLSIAAPPLADRFDMAISLEVAEHLPSQRSDQFVADLCALSDVVLFSAAIEGQLGTDHVNLQPQSRWAQRFAGLGYQQFDLVRPLLWNDDRVEYFYRQNTLVYVNTSRTDLVQRAVEQVAATPPLTDAVHPALLQFWVRRATRPVSTGQAFRLLVGAVGQAVTRRLHR
jgi:SAM-dependent methyltransferase